MCKNVITKAITLGFGLFWFFLFVWFWFWFFYRASVGWNQESRRRFNEFTENEVEVEQLLYCSAGANYYTMAPNGEGAAKGLSPVPSRDCHLTPAGIKE